MKTKSFVATAIILSSLMISNGYAQEVPWLRSLAQSAAGSFVGFGVTKLLGALFPPDAPMKKAEVEAMLNRAVSDINATTGEIVGANDLRQLNGEVAAMFNRLPPRQPVSRNFQTTMDDVMRDINSDMALLGKLESFGPSGTIPMRVAGAHIIGRQELLTNLWRAHLGYAVVMGQSKPGGRSNEDSIKGNIKGVRDSETKIKQQLVANMTKTKDHFHIWKSEGRYPEKTRLEIAAEVTPAPIDHGPYRDNSDYSCKYICKAKLTFSPLMAWTTEGDGAYRGKVSFETSPRDMGTEFMGMKVFYGQMRCIANPCLATPTSDSNWKDGLAYLNGAHSPVWGDINAALANLAGKYLGVGWEQDLQDMNRHIQSPYNYDATSTADRYKAATDTCNYIGYKGGIPVGQAPQGYYCYNQIKSFAVARVQDAQRNCKQNGFPTGYGTPLKAGNRAFCVKQ